MALFGAPIAHEDHAARACHAALRLCEELAGFSVDLRREHGLNFLVRIGLNSGEVVVGGIGEDLEMEYTAIGQTVGLAQRMEALAEPGKAYLTERTASEVEGYFDLRGAALIDAAGARGYEPLVHEQRAGLAELGGDTEMRERELRTAQRQFGALGATTRATGLAAELTHVAG